MQTSRQRTFEIDRQTILERASTFVKQLQRKLALCEQALGNMSAILAEPTSVPAPRRWL
jgi:hypothetical protein